MLQVRLSEGLIGFLEKETEKNLLHLMNIKNN